MSIRRPTIRRRCQHCGHRLMVGQFRCPECATVFVPRYEHGQPRRLLDRIESFSSGIPAWVLLLLGAAYLIGFGYLLFLWAVHAGEIERTAEGWRWVS